MKYEVPCVIHSEPTKEWIKTLYPEKKDGFRRKLALQTAKNVWTRTRLSERQNHRCCWCGCETVPEPDRPNSATIEHIIPRSQGGTDEEDNLAMSCKLCNNRRGTLSVEVFMDLLERREVLGRFPKAHGKPSRIDRRKEQVRIMLQVLKHEPNPYEPGSRAYKTFERYLTAPQLHVRPRELKRAPELLPFVQTSKVQVAAA